MAEALKLATSQGCRTTTHGGSISRLFSSRPVAPLSGIVGCRGNGYGGDLAVGFGCGRMPCDCGFVVVFRVNPGVG
uniref:Uncharacterized protein n=1 Tax=Fagus sylvatica TaxID=28930 RepID=A0A2N9EVB6_FAGSY